MNAKRKGTRNEHRAIRILEAAGYACTRAERKMGQMLRQTPRADEVAGPGRGKNRVPRKHSVLDPPTLAEIGVTKKESAQAQKLAAVPERKFNNLPRSWR